MAKITTKVEGREIVIEGETADEAMRLYQLFRKIPEHEANWSLKEPVADANPEPDEIPRPNLVIGEGLTEHGRTPTIDTKAVLARASARKFKIGDKVKFISGALAGKIGVITQSGQRFVNPWIVISFPDGTDHKILGDDYSSIIEHLPEEPSVREVTNLPESQWENATRVPPCGGTRLVRNMTPPHLAATEIPKWAPPGDEHAKLNVENGKASVSDVKMVRPPMSDLVFRTDTAGNTLPEQYINESTPGAEKPWVPIRDFQVQTDPGKSRGRLVAEAAIKLDERQGTIVILGHDFPKSGAYGFKVDDQHRESILNFLHEYMGSHFDAEIERAVNATVKKFRDATVQAFDKMDQDNCPLQAKGAREIYRILGLGFTGNK